jgi:hypothetical protein
MLVLIFVLYNLHSIKICDANKVRIFSLYCDILGMVTVFILGLSIWPLLGHFL